MSTEAPPFALHGTVVKKSRSGTRFFVRLAAESGALQRVLQPFTVEGILPAQLTIRRREGRFFMVLLVDDVTAERAQHLRRRIAQMPCVLTARTSSRQVKRVAS